VVRKGRENRPMLIKFPTFGRKQFYTAQKKKPVDTNVSGDAYFGPETRKIKRPEG
jgi:hypothetical protein